MSYEEWTDRDLLEEACDIESGLSSWEVDFIEDLSRRLPRDPISVLTDRQRAKVIQILRRVL